MSIKYVTLLFIIITAFILHGCDGTTNPFSPPYDAYNIFVTGAPHDPRELSVPLNIAISAVAEQEIKVGIGGYSESEGRFDPYYRTSWSLVESPDPLPSFLSITFDPTTLTDSLPYTTMKIAVTAPYVNGTYRFAIEVNRSDFENPRRINLVISVNVPSSIPNIDFTPDTLYAPPGGTGTVHMKVNGILPGAEFKFGWDVMLGGPAYLPYLSATRTTFTSDSTEADIALSLPASYDLVYLIPEVYVENTVSGERFYYGLPLVQTGFRVTRISPGDVKVALNATHLEIVSYNKYGPGLLTPKIELLPVSSSASYTAVPNITKITESGYTEVTFSITPQSVPSPTDTLKFRITADMVNGKPDTTFMNLIVE